MDPKLPGHLPQPKTFVAEIKLTNVARASLVELLEDYRDFLLVRDLPSNIAICLIHPANYLLDQQMRLEKTFLKEGGLRERMTRAMLKARSEEHKPR